MVFDKLHYLLFCTTTANNIEITHPPSLPPFHVVLPLGKRRGDNTFRQRNIEKSKDNAFTLRAHVCVLVLNNSPQE